MFCRGFSVAKKNWNADKISASRKNYLRGVVLIFVLGFYDGFFDDFLFNIFRGNALFAK